MKLQRQSKKRMEAVRRRVIDAAHCDWCLGAWGITKKRSWMCTGCGARLCRNTYCCELYHTQKDKWDDKLHAAHNAKQGKMI